MLLKGVRARVIELVPGQTLKGPGWRRLLKASRLRKEAGGNGKDVVAIRCNRAVPGLLVAGTAQTAL